MRESTDLQPVESQARAGNAKTFAPTRVSWPHLVLGALGFAISFYSLVVHNRLKAGQATGCDISETINCEEVLSSQYGTWFHVPWGVWGMAFFVVVVLSASAKEANVADGARTAAWRLAIASCGILTSIVLTYVSKVLIGALCPVCLATHAVTLSLFVVSLFAYFKAREGARKDRLPAA